MASSAGRRNILREIPGALATGSINNNQNITFHLPPTPTSPEEEVIRQRGRRKIAQLVSDVAELTLPRTPSKSPRKTLTPQKRLNTPTKYGSTPTRTSPRKRLNLTQDNLETETLTVNSGNTVSPRKAKRSRLQSSDNTHQNLEKSLIALSHAQLVELLTSAISSSPEIRQVLINLLPPPDLATLEAKLHYLQRNVFKSFPRSIWGSQQDSFCFRRVRTHLDAFKKECMEQCRRLVDSQNWPSVLEYILIAWSYVKGLPDWDDVSHNKLKNQCFKQLAAHFINALKKSKLEKVDLEEIIKRLKEIQIDDNIVSACLKQAESQLQMK